MEHKAITIIEKINKDNKKLFIDYEGTISTSPVFDKNRSNLNQLLFCDVFSECTPIEYIKEILDKIQCKADQIYIVGIVDTNIEIEQKYQWLEKYYPYINKGNIIFVTGEHKKVDVLNEYVQYLKVKKEQIIFVDDKESHLKFARDGGYECYNVDELKED